MSLDALRWTGLSRASCMWYRGLHRNGLMTRGHFTHVAVPTGCTDCQPLRIQLFEVFILAPLDPATCLAILMPSCIFSSTAPLQLKLKTVCEHGETHVAADIISNTPSAHRRSNTFQTIRTLNTCFRRFFAQEIMFCVKAERPLTWAIQMSQATHFFHSHSA